MSQGVEAVEVVKPGATVTVRGSTWAVTQVVPQAVGSGAAHHVVSLQCLAEDRMGHELTVVWEHEVGASVSPSRVIPTEINAAIFEDPDAVGACVDAVRWGAVTSADSSAYQSPFRSGLNIEAYQLEPLRRALSSPRTNLLLADDVGLGKTIEAGLVLQELVLRQQVHSAVIVCPPSLALKWQQEMRDRFGLTFTIVNSECLTNLRRTHGLHANPFVVFPKVIVSMAWLASPRAQRLLRPVLAQAGPREDGYAFDMLIVDEAHHVAPASPTRKANGAAYAVDSQRTIRTRELAECCEHRLFLSATPHNGYTESFTALLEMIDNRRFTRGMKPKAEDIQQVTVRRLKTDVVEKGFKRRELMGIGFDPDPAEVEHYQLLRDVLQRSAKRNGKRAVDGLFSSLITKRFLSSPWSFHESLAAFTTVGAGAEPRWADDYYTEVLGLGQSDEEEGLAEHPEATAMRKAKGADVLSAATASDVDKLLGWSSQYEARPDSRLRALGDFLETTCRPDGKLWTDERVVVFTEYRDTLEWIKRYLETQGFKGERVAVIHGGVGAEDRELVRDAFTSPPTKEPVRVLLATDSAGEGIDLQDYCHRLVNFDLPFNPSRLEQRIGRIDRYGQRNVPKVFTFRPVHGSSLYEGHYTQIAALLTKMRSVSRDLGAANEVVSQAGAAQAKRQTALELQAVSTSTGVQVADVPEVLSRSESGYDEVERGLEGSRSLNADLKKLMRDYEKRKAELHVTPDACERVLRHALDMAHEPPLRASNEWVEDTEAAVFDVPEFGRAWREACAGLDTLKHPGAWRPITFDQAAARSVRGVVHVHLGHALLQRAARSLRASVTGAESLRGVTAVVSDDVDASCVVAVARVVMLGAGGVRLHEEVVESGIRLRGQNLSRDKAKHALAVALDSGAELAPLAVREHVAQEWNSPSSRVRERMTERLAAGVKDAMDDTLNTLIEREEQDKQRVLEIFASARKTLEETKADLADELDGQGTLWALDEQRQRERDLQRVLERLNTVDERRDAELRLLERRYREPRDEKFPVALVFVVTRNDAAKWGA